MMGTWWDSPDRLAFIFRLLTFVSVGCAAVFGIALFLINDRIGQLQSFVIEKQDGRIQGQSLEINRQADQILNQRTQVEGLDSEVERLKRTAQALTLKAQNSERGVSDIYDFRGNRRQMAGSRLVVTAGGPTVESFKQMSQQRAESRWADLKNEAEAQIAKVPTWLTPSLFSGIALANLGDLINARERLKHLVEVAGNDPEYRMVVGVLEEVEMGIAQLKR